MNILCVGDVFAQPGRNILRQELPRLISEYAADFVIVNGENASGGRGITPQAAIMFGSMNRLGHILSVTVSCVPTTLQLDDQAEDVECSSPQRVV